MSIKVCNVTKKFGDFSALKNIHLEVPSGELVALLGPSGSGKTTLLRIVAGLEEANDGSVLFFGEDAKNQHVKNRKVGFVFQHYALFRHMSVFENVAFGLRVRPKNERPSEEKIKAKVNELLKLVQLERLGPRFPAQLSGGQRQRVALARALAVEPKVLLLDEPFGSLDAKVRKELRQWLRNLHDEMHITSIFVTHDQEEALEVADRVVIMNEGNIEQVGTPEEVYHYPKNPFVYNFLGNVNLFHGRVEEGNTVIENTAASLPNIVSGESGSKTMIYIRPHLLDIVREATGAANHFRGTVKHVNPAGPLVRVELMSEWGTLVYVELSQERYRALNLKRGEDVFVRPKEMKIFNQDFSI